MEDRTKALRLKLSPRLELVASLVPRGARLVDVGTDHGYVPVRLIEAGIVDRAAATDINPGPLDSARRTARARGVLDRLLLVLCDGLRGIEYPEAYDTVIIAGVGGETIQGILQDAPWTNSADVLLILQPMSKQPELRRWLWEQGHEITWEGLSGDGEKIYNIMTARGGGEAYPHDIPAPGEIYAGRISGDTDRELHARYMDGLVKKLSHALDGISRSEREEDRERGREIRAALNEINRMKGRQ